MISYIVIFEARVRGVYTCGADANTRLKELQASRTATARTATAGGGGEVVIGAMNRDID